MQCSVKKTTSKPTSTTPLFGSLVMQLRNCKWVPTNSLIRFVTAVQYTARFVVLNNILLGQKHLSSLDNRIDQVIQRFHELIIEGGPPTPFPQLRNICLTSAAPTQGFLLHPCATYGRASRPVYVSCLRRHRIYP